MEAKTGVLEFLASMAVLCVGLGLLCLIVPCIVSIFG
jgi:hypothetical protein